jgi:hypothetical protein
MSIIEGKLESDAPLGYSTKQEYYNAQQEYQERYESRRRAQAAARAGGSSWVRGVPAPNVGMRPGKALLCALTVGGAIYLLQSLRGDLDAIGLAIGIGLCTLVFSLLWRVVLSIGLLVALVWAITHIGPTVGS